MGPFRRNAEDTSEALKRFGVDAYNALDKGWDARLGRWQSMGAAESEFRKETEQLDNAFAELVNQGNLSAATDGIDQFKQAGVEAGVPLAVLDAQFPKFNEAMKTAGANAVTVAGATGEVATGFDAQGKAAATAGLSQKELNASMSEYTSQVLALRGDQRAFEAAIDSATAAVKANGRTLDDNTEKGRANNAALDAIADAGQRLAEQTPKGSNAQEHFSKTLATTRKRLEEAAFQMTGSRKRARELATSILGVPSVKRTNISQPGMKPALSNTDSLDRRLRNLPTYKQINVNTHFYQTGKGPGTFGNGLGVRIDGARAAGGPVKAGNTYIVGERGQELFVPKEDGVIIPEVPAPGRPDALKKRRVGTPENIFHPGRNSTPSRIEFVTDGSRASQALLAILRESVRIRGGNVQLVIGR
jgi:hypothetical protein